eukprot:6492778-Amphidinium_carterae.4
MSRLVALTCLTAVSCSLELPKAATETARFISGASTTSLRRRRASKRCIKPKQLCEWQSELRAAGADIFGDTSISNIDASVGAVEVHDAHVSTQNGPSQWERCRAKSVSKYWVHMLLNVRAQSRHAKAATRS